MTGPTKKTFTNLQSKANSKENGITLIHMSLLIGSSTANLRATKQYYKFGNPHTNMKDSNSR
jgi:hypothetical protein